MLLKLWNKIQSPSYKLKKCTFLFNNLSNPKQSSQVCQSVSLLSLGGTQNMKMYLLARYLSQSASRTLGYVKEVIIEGWDIISVPNVLKALSLTRQLKTLVTSLILNSDSIVQNFLPGNFSTEGVFLIIKIGDVHCLMLLTHFKALADTSIK